MSTQINHEPAFPQPMFARQADGQPISSFEFGLGGMSLRGYFAAKALCGYLSGRSQYDASTYENIAKESYLYADAMLKAREAV